MSQTTLSAATRSRGRALVKAVRLYQWVKNGLIFLPMLMGHRLLDAEVWLSAGLAFLALSLCASGTYVLNDLLDREADRLHPTKRHRPFASGALAPEVGYVLAPALVAMGFALAVWQLPAAFTAVLGLYLLTTVAYSYVLKRMPLVDVLVLAGLYALRVFAGGAATGIPISQWLLSFSLFFFLSLALLKRYAELRILETNIEARANKRGYQVDDLSMLRNFGTTSAYLAVLVLALYLTSPEVTVLYQMPALLWLLSPLLIYWQMRIWLLAHRGQMDDDPILFTVKDPASYLVFGGIAALLVAATLVHV
ncbi:MAG: UbiA family prenyltransferase [Bacteroidota bacterium]